MLTWSIREALLFFLLTLRMGGLMAFTPFFGSTVVPVRVRICLSLVLAYAVFGALPRQDLPESVGGYFVAVLGEMAVGAALGLVCNILYTAVQFAGQMVDHELGFTMNELLDPFTEESGTLTGQFQFFLLMVLILLMGGHLRFLEVFLETVSRVPLGLVSPGHEFINVLAGVLAISFQIAVKFAAPLLALSFLLNVALGFASRAVPALNVLVIGFPVKILMGLGLMMVAMGQIMYHCRTVASTCVEETGKAVNALMRTDG
ncbi:MAG: flagellar biosynthetic protein FliR [Planctomycetota bacterium]